MSAEYVMKTEERRLLEAFTLGAVLGSQSKEIDIELRLVAAVHVPLRKCMLAFKGQPLVGGYIAVEVSAAVPLIARERHAIRLQDCPAIILAL